MLAVSQPEALESRLLLTSRYVDNPGDYTITNDTGAAGLSSGDTVTWNGGTPVAGLTFGSTAFSTIQSAVNFATAGDTINVAKGTYAEAVAISKSLTLLGAQAGVTEAGRVFGVATESTLNPVAGAANLNGIFGVFNVSAANVTIDGFSVGVTGAIPGSGGGIYQSSPSSGGYTVKNNIVNGFTNRIGINVAVNTTGALIQGNRVENSFSGIYFSNLATGTVTGNTFKDVHDGVNLVEGGNTATISNNTFTNVSEHGIQVDDGNSAQTTGNIGITGNSFTNVAAIVANFSTAGVTASNSTVNGVADATVVAAPVAGGTITILNNGGVLSYRIGAGAITPLVVGTGPVLVIGDAGNDNLVVDFTGGNLLPAAGLIYTGGAGSDSLTLQGGTFTTGRVSASGVGAGTIQYNGVGLITFSGLEPIVDNNVVTNYTIDATAGADTIVIENGVNANHTRVRETGNLFESVEFINKTNVTVNGLGGDDTFTLNNPTPATGLTSLIVDGGIGADTLTTTAAFSTGTLNLSVDTVNLANDLTGSTLLTGTASTINVATTAFIQDAIDISGAGATINIAAGTYVGDVNATAGGKSVTLAPVGTGTVTVTGNVALNAGDALQIQMAGSGAGTFDNFVVSGTVALGGATLVPSLSYVPVLGVPVQIVTVGSGVPGTFAGLPEGGVVTIGSNRLKVSYIGGSGNDVTLTAVGPAVSVSFVNGNLVVTGTGNIDDFTIQVAGLNMVTLIGNGLTNFTGAGGDGATVGPFLVTKNLTVNTGNGNDIVHLTGNGVGAQLDSGTVSIDLGTGNDTLNQTGTDPLKFTGSLSVLGGTGSDAITFGLGTTVTDLTALGITVDNGTDDNATTQSITFNGVTANGNVSLTNSGQALQSVVFGATANALKGNVVITQSNAANTLGYQVTASNSPVTGNLTITNGNTTGATSVAWSTSNVGGTASVVNGNAASNSTVFTTDTIGGNVTVSNGTAGTTNVITVTGSTFSKSSTLTNGTAGTSNTINLGLTTLSTFGGIVTAANNSATGANSIIVQQGNLNGGGSLSNAVAGAASNTITLGTAGTVNSVGNLALTNAASVTSNTVNVSQLITSGNKAGDLTVNNGATGTTNVTFGAAGANTVNGNLTIRNQATTGTRTTTINGTTVNGGTGFYLYNVGAGTAATTIGSGATVVVAKTFKIEDGTGNSTFDVRNVTLGSFNYLDIGGGTDVVDLAGAGGGVATVSGVTRISTGDGSDTVRIGTTGTANLNDSVFITLGGGDDTLIIGANASSAAFSTASKYQFDGGAGVDLFTGSLLSLAEYDGVKPTKKLKSKITNFETYN